MPADVLAPGVRASSSIRSAKIAHGRRTPSKRRLNRGADADGDRTAKAALIEFTKGGEGLDRF
ncbi:hypothetical protein ACXX9E_29295 [Pseudomonas sp. GNP014]